MEAPNSNLNKQKVVDRSRDTQALWVVAGASLALVEGLVIAGSSRPSEPLADPLKNNTLYDTSSRSRDAR
ncbi:UNVERIFIED_CONTAM: hypothetical protein Slati_1771800 [Sesamum latifolium]|uniref:Uncharacterized protein n=1 Tax=Sesamum latifolium TaxID=2727402 RepID=A0AAW2WXX2_9LAMI